MKDIILGILTFMISIAFLTAIVEFYKDKNRPCESFEECTLKNIPTRYFSYFSNNKPEATIITDEGEFKIDIPRSICSTFEEKRCLSSFYWKNGNSTTTLKGFYVNTKKMCYS